MYRGVSYRDRRSWGATEFQPIRILHNIWGVQNHKFLLSQGEVKPISVVLNTNSANKTHKQANSKNNTALRT